MRDLHVNLVYGTRMQIRQYGSSSLTGGTREIGIVPLAVTTNLSINFLRKPPSTKAIVGVCRLMKLGKSLAVGEVALYSEGTEEPVAHAVGTYALPRKPAA